MKEMQIFSNPDFGQVRTITINGEPWFVGKDVAMALGYSNHRDALYKHVDSEDKRESRIATPSGTQTMTIINESGLYSMIFGSKLESAKQFKHWVTSEVLPSIRKTGKYIVQSESKVEFILQNMDSNMKIVYAQINSMEEILDKQNMMLSQIVDNMTLSTRQQQKLYKAAKDRINHLLGGAHSPEYKKNAKSYFINLWNGLKSLYGCASYKDLNPKYYNVAFDYISEWEYIET